MGQRVSLSDSDDYVAVLAPEFYDTLLSNRLGNDGRERVLKTIRDAISQLDPARPPHTETEPVESTDELEKLYATNEIRIWCRAVRDLDGYEVLFVLDIDPAHRYSQTELTDLDDDVKAELRSVGNVGSEGADSYLEQYELLDESDIQEMVDKLN